MQPVDDARPTRSRWIAALGALAALLPAVASWILKTRVWPRPFWVFYYDPETIYFYSGLSLLRGFAPQNVDNPGTPLQVVSAAIAAFTGATPLHYEAFLEGARWISLLLSVAGVLVIHFVVMRGAPLLMRVAASWACFAAPAAFERLNIWGPEVLYLPTGATVLAMLRLWWETPGRARAAMAGAVCGLGVAAKFAFAPVAAALVVTFVAARRTGHAVVASLAVIAGFVAGTLPVIRVWDTMFRRLLFLSGEGHADHTWRELLATSHAWQLLLLVAAALAVWRFRRAAMPWVVFAGALLVLSAAATARNPSFRYLLPAAIAVVALLAARALVDPPPRWSQGALLVFVGLLVAKAFVGDLRAHRERIAEGVALRMELEAAVPRDAITLYGWRAPVPSFALRAESSDARDRRDISRRYPRHGHVDPWTGAVVLPHGSRRWDYVVVSERDLRHIPAGTYEIESRVRGYVVARATTAVDCVSGTSGSEP